MFERTRKIASVVGLCDNPDDIYAGDGLVDQVEVDGEFNTLNEIDAAFSADKVVIKNPDDCGLVKAMSLNPRKDFEILTPLFGVCTGKVKIMKFSCPDCGHEDTMTPDEFESNFDSDMDADITCQNCDHEGEICDFHDCTVEEVQTTRNISPSEVASVLGGEFESDDAWLVLHYGMYLKHYFALLSGVQCMSQENLEGLSESNKKITINISTQLGGYEVAGKLHAIDTHQVSAPTDDWDDV